MTVRRVAISTGPTESTVTISALGGTSLRSVERVLSAAGVTGHIVRTSKKVYLTASDFSKSRDAFRGWDLEIDGKIERCVTLLARATDDIIRQKEVIEDILGKNPSATAIDCIPDLVRLDAHQVQAVAVATHPEIKGLCLFDEQGLGKTVMTLAAYHMLKQAGDVTRLLVIAPKNVVFEWVRDTERFFGSKYMAKPVVGTKREKRQGLNVHADIYITNFETTVTLYYRLRDLLEAEQGKILLVVDESFFVKNPGARRTRAIKGLRKSVERCIVLCGTPAPNSPHDIVEQFNIADGGVAFNGVSLPKEREEARPVVQSIIRERGLFIRRLKQDVLPDLPGKTFHRLLLRMQTEQEAVYKAALREYIQGLRSVSEMTFRKQLGTFMARRFALLQICTTPASVVTGYTEVPAKILALDSILDELILKQKEKVIVWSFFTASLDNIYKRYARFHPIRFDGTIVNPIDRKNAVRDFQEDDRSMLFVANPAAAGAGLTLHRARYAIYESLPVQAAHYFQSLDRIHRRGQLRPVEYLVLLCDRTIELNEYERLVKKEKSAHKLLGDVAAELVTRTALLQEAVEAAHLVGLLGSGEIRPEGGRDA